MKKFVFGLVTAFMPMLALGQSDFSATWELTGSPFSIYDSADMDLDIGTQFISAHGGINTDDGLTLPVAGTCFFTVDDGVFCSFVLPEGLTGVLDLGPNGNGEWRVLDINGDIEEFGDATLVDLI